MGTAKFARDVDALPPYGLTNAENAGFLGMRPVPLGFRLDPDNDAVASATEWEAWVARRAGHMADFLWPLYVPSNGWQGKARDIAVELTGADLDIIAALQPQMGHRIVNADGKPSGRCRDAFRDEDDAPPGKTLAHYTCKFPESLKDELGLAIKAGGTQRARPASQAMKSLFQRPRAQQIALLWDVGTRIQVERSATAITPAMISGHCIQGSLALVNVEHELGTWFAAFTDVQQQVQRFLVDTGDRRVLAGLHYPSDNIGSWYVAMCLCEHLYGASRGAAYRQALWQAIQAHSVVYLAIRDAAAKGVSVYTPLLAWLEKAATDGDRI